MFFIIFMVLVYSINVWKSCWSCEEIMNEIQNFCEWQILSYFVGRKIFNYQVTNIQKTFDTNADSPHQTVNILKPVRDNLAFTILMMAQIVLNWEINLRNIIRKRAVEHDQFNIKRINNIVDCNWNIFGSLSEKNDIKNNNTPINNLFDFSYLW